MFERCKFYLELFPPCKCVLIVRIKCYDIGFGLKVIPRFQVVSPLLVWLSLCNYFGNSEGEGLPVPLHRGGTGIEGEPVSKYAYQRNPLPVVTLISVIPGSRPRRVLSPG